MRAHYAFSNRLPLKGHAAALHVFYTFGWCHWCVWIMCSSGASCTVPWTSRVLCGDHPCVIWPRHMSSLWTVTLEAPCWWRQGGRGRSTSVRFPTGTAMSREDPPCFEAVLIIRKRAFPIRLTTSSVTKTTTKKLRTIVLGFTDIMCDWKTLVLLLFPNSPDLLREPKFLTMALLPLFCFLWGLLSATCNNLIGWIGLIFLYRRKKYFRKTHYYLAFVSYVPLRNDSTFIEMCSEVFFWVKSWTLWVHCLEFCFFPHTST